MFGLQEIKVYKIEIGAIFNGFKPETQNSIPN